MTECGLPGAKLKYVEDFLAPAEADAQLASVLRDIAFEQHVVKVFGKEHPCPRRSAFLGDEEAVYRYSGQTLVPRPWTAALADLRERLSADCEVPFDSVLVNLYRDGADSMGWHSDDEWELGPTPTIASVSLGSARRFLLRHRHDKDRPTAEWSLGHGALFVMAGETQRYYKHAVPKTRRAVGLRVNLSFRQIRSGRD